MWTTPALSQVRSITSLTMTFDNLFQDLESQLERELDAELRSRLDDEERDRRSKLTLRERLKALQSSTKGFPLTALTADHRTISFTLKNIGKDWIAAEVHRPAELEGSVLFSLQALMVLEIPEELEKVSMGPPVGTVTDASLAALTQTPRLAEKITLGFVLRDIGRRRKQVTVFTSHGISRGMIDHVGADHLDIATVSGRKMYGLRDVLYLRME